MSELVERLRCGLEYDIRLGEIKEAEAEKLMDEAASALEAQEARIQELEAALAFYAFEDNYQDRVVTRSCGCCSDFLDSATKEDGGDLARRALSHINTNEAEK